MSAKDTPQSRPEAGVSRRLLLGRPRLSGPAVLGATLGINLLSLALPIAILQVYDRVIPESSTQTLALLISGVAAAIVLESLLRASRTAVVSWRGAQFEHRIGTEAIRRLLGADLEDLDRHGAGGHLESLSAIEQIRAFYATQAPQLSVDLPFSLIFLALIFVIAGPLMLVPLVMFALVGTATLILGGRLRSAIRQRTVLDDREFNFIVEALHGIHTVKAFAMEGMMCRRRERLNEQNIEVTYRIARLNATSLAISMMFSQVTMACVAAAGSLLVIEGYLSIGAIAASMLLSGRAVQPLLRGLNVWTQYQTLRVARRNLRKVANLHMENADRRVEVGDLSGRIVIDQVTYSHGETATPLFEDLSLEVAPGECVAIHGTNGSGKSSLLWLLSGVYLPQKGTIRFDDHDTRTIDPRTLRRQVTFIPQRSIMLEGTLLENLTGFRVEERLDDALYYARALGLDEMIARLPKGLDTRVGTSANDALSEAFREQITIARALAARPKVVLFDESNTSLDYDADQRLRACLADLKGEASLVLVSQRPSLRQLADRVFELQDGRLEPSWTGQPAPKPAPTIVGKAHG